MSSQSFEFRWPGERENPTHHEVEAANELPDSSFLSTFKVSLLASPEASQMKPLMQGNLTTYASKEFTYPMAVLSNFPPLPSQEELDHLRDVFEKWYSTHIFVGHLPSNYSFRDSILPPLRFATACLGSFHAGHFPNQARDLFLAGAKLSVVMLEVDNREARSLDMLFACILLVTYGEMSSDPQVQDIMTLVLCSSITMTRRMRLNDNGQLEHFLSRRASPYSEAFVWSLWMIDILHGLHSQLAVNSISSREIWTKMPSSAYEFQTVYDRLLDGTNPVTLPEPLTNDDGVLLLMAMLSDLMFLRRSLGALSDHTDPSSIPGRNRHNPFVPLSPHTETQRMERLLAGALDRWHESIKTILPPPEIMALYHYCRLHLLYPQILSLPHIAGHKSVDDITNLGSLSGRQISDRAIWHAWRILDDAAGRSKPNDPYTFCPLWLPVVVFHAGLVIWAKQGLGPTQDGSGYGSMRILLPFVVELKGMPWPCCKEMAETLKRLVSGCQPRELD